MKRILVLSMRFPYPPYGGEKFPVFSYLGVLAGKGYQIDLVSFEDQSRIDKALVDELRKKIPAIRKIEILFVPKVIRILGAAFGFLLGKPLQVGYFSNVYTRRWFGKTGIVLSDYSHLFVHTIRLAEIAPVISDKKNIIYLVDSIARNYSFSYRYQPFFKKIIFALEAARLKKYEKLMINRYDLSIFHSQADIDYLGVRDASRVMQMPVMKRRSKSFKKIDRYTIKRFLLIGKYSYFPNIDALLYLLKNDERIAQGDYTIDIIGGFMNEKMAKRIRDSKSLVYHGVVDDIEPLILDSYGVICPIRIGAGMQNKILDALVCGRPSVAYEFSALPYLSYLQKKGIDSETDSGILGFKSSDEFIARLNSLMDIDYANRIAEKAYDSSRYFDIKILDEEFDRILE